MAEAPAYQTAYEKDGKPICPECGYDFTGQKSDNVLAHSVNHWTDIDSHETYDLARHRQGILKKIAQELGN